MSNIVETTFGTLVDAKRIAKGCASNIQKRGAFYIFSIRIENDDIRSILQKRPHISIMILFRYPMLCLTSGWCEL